MKKSFGGAGVLLVTLASWAQVQIISFDRNGTLAWTNFLGPGVFDDIPDTDPVYRVEWAGSPIGPWNTLTNTTQTSVSVTNSGPRGERETFYRVAWTNGQVWSYQGYDGPNLIVTGRLYFNVSFMVDGGSWNLARTGLPGNPWHRAGTGALDSCFDCVGRIYLDPYCCDNTFSLDGPTPTSTTWTGTWHWVGFALDATGAFVAERIPDGK